MSKPNILIFMVDQLNGTLFPDGPADWLHAPNIKALAERSTRFQNAYTASPLCAPGRASFMSGQLPSRTGVYDNAAEFASSIPTYVHHLRRAGYYTCLSGKMHFVGPDQLHGFEDRLTTDVYPPDFGWTPDYRKPGERIDWWYHNMGSVTGAGVAEISNQLEYDDEVAAMASQKLYQLSRGLDERPWSLTVSFTHPHDPYVSRKKFWDLYEDCEHLEPVEGPYAFDDLDAHSQRIMLANDHTKFDITDEDVRRSRRAYFANISYLDDKIGELLRVLKETRQADNTIIAFVADHGDMLGEKGLWFKMNFYEGSARVPLMIAAPSMEPGLITAPVSTIDMAPTIADLAGISMDDVMPWTEGESLVPPGQGVERTSPVAMEYAAEASYAPLVSLRYGKWKYNRCTLDPEQLFDMEADPQERVNLASIAEHQGTLNSLRAKSKARWDLDAFDSDVRESQARRWVVYEALRKGGTIRGISSRFRKRPSGTCVTTWTSMCWKRTRGFLVGSDSACTVVPALNPLPGRHSLAKVERGDHSRVAPPSAAPLWAARLATRLCRSLGETAPSRYLLHPVATPVCASLSPAGASAPTRPGAPLSASKRL